MTRRLTVVIWAALLPMFAAGAVLADVVHLKSGQKYEGAAEEKDGTVVLKLERGSLTFTKDQVDRVEKSAPPWEVYEQKAKELKREDVSGHLDLAKWCKAHGLLMRMKQELEHVISVDPESTEARAMLGHKKVGDKWLTPEEQQPVKAPRADPPKDPGKDPGKDPAKPPSGTVAAGPPDGTYRCKSRGYVDDLEVEVVVVLGMISELKVTEHKENGRQAQLAIKDVPLRIVDKQSVKVDGTSSATATSNAIKRATAGALASARPVAPSAVPDGSYVGMSRGMRGDITVQVTVKGGRIVSAGVSVHRENGPETAAAVKDVPNRIKDTQNTQVDAASGATVTSRAIMRAAQTALENATAPKPAPPPPGK